MELVSFVLTICTLIQYINGQRGSCITPLGFTGVCVPLLDCEELKLLVKGTLEDRELLKAWHCGFIKDDPQVCCPLKQQTTIPTLNKPKTSIRTTTETVPSTLTTKVTTTATTTKAPTKTTAARAPITAGQKKASPIIEALTTKPTTAASPSIKSSTVKAATTKSSTTEALTTETSTAKAPTTKTTTVKPSTTVTPSDICYTLEATRGTCVALAECPAMQEMLRTLKKDDLEYVQRSRCIGPVRYSVCCDKPLSKNFINNTASEEVNQARRRKRIPEVSDKIVHQPDAASNRCGTESLDKNHKSTAIRKHPWLAIIEYAAESFRFKCGGTLISSQYVLTAAHCVVTEREKADKGAKYVRLGEYNVTNEGKDCVKGDNGVECTDGAISIPIASVIVHTKYAAGDVPYANDIALLKLNSTAPYNDFIRPICLPTAELPLSPSKSPMRFKTAGWGTVDKATLHTSDIKQDMDVPFVDNARCNDIYKYKDKKIVWEKQICAGGEQKKNSCKADSGGPLVYEGKDKYELIGIHSYGLFVCGLQEKPSLYTKVYDYLPWIMSFIKA